MSAGKPAFIFDLDGTLADITHRLHFIKGEKKDWNTFNRFCSSDSPKEDIIAIANNLNMDYYIIIMSGRMDNEDIRERTEVWLKANQVPYDYLYMRPDNDFRADHEVKRELYITHVEPEYDVLGVFDDRNQVVEMWREIGLTCCQVQPGDY